MSNIKGVPVMDILRAYAKYPDFHNTRRRFPRLSYSGVRDAVLNRDHVLIPELFERGSTPRQVADEFGLSISDAHLKQKKAQRDAGIT